MSVNTIQRALMLTYMAEAQIHHGVWKTDPKSKNKFSPQLKNRIRHIPNITLVEIDLEKISACLVLTMSLNVYCRLRSVLKCIRL